MHTDLPKHGPALAIVAHPDDEVLWCGGVILAHPNLNWTIVSACRASDPDRRPRFEEACRELGATGHILDTDDSPVLKRLDLGRDLCDPLLDLVSDRNWQICLTHGKNGEYGHHRHTDVHHAVNALIADERLSCHRFWTFAYETDDDRNVFPAPEATITFLMANDVYHRKKRMIGKVYGFTPDSFEQRACLEIESFRRVPVNQHQGDQP